MKTEFDEYQRIGKGFLGMSSLWLGDDHLLYIKGSGLFLPFREEYRRFRYQDIQNVSIVKTGGMWGFGALLLVSLATFALITYGIISARDPDSNFGLIWMLALPLPLALLSFVFLVRNFILGPRCICVLQTALKKESIGPLSRLIKAKQVIAVLDERIREQQSDVAAGIAGGESPDIQAPLPQEIPKLAPLGLVISLVTGILFVLATHFGSQALVITSFVGLLVSVFLTFSNVIISVRKPCPESLRSTLWTVLGSILSVSGTGLVYFAFLSIADPSYTIDAGGPVRAFMELSSKNDLAFYLIFMVLGSLIALASFVGFLVSLRFGKFTSKVKSE